MTAYACSTKVIQPSDGEGGKPGGGCNGDGKPVAVAARGMDESTSREGQGIGGQ